jgi:hypothetical protein
MTREDIIQMAQKAGFVWLGEYHSNLEDFAKLVAQHEREACAKLCAEWSDYTNGIAPTLAERIRARGQA